MNAEVKKRWIAALRSGAYKQGKGALKANDKFCCLGVLCDLHAKEFGAAWIKSMVVVGADTENSETVRGDCYLGHTGLSPMAVRAWLDTPSYGSIEHSLVHLNDKGSPFNEIADYIEAHLV